MTRVAEQHGERIYGEFIRRKVALEYVIVFWSSIHALLTPLKQTISLLFR